MCQIRSVILACACCLGGTLLLAEERPHVRAIDQEPFWSSQLHHEVLSRLASDQPSLESDNGDSNHAPLETITDQTSQSSSLRHRKTRDSPSNWESEVTHAESDVVRESQSNVTSSLVTPLGDVDSLFQPQFSIEQVSVEQPVFEELTEPDEAAIQRAAVVDDFLLSQPVEPVSHNRRSVRAEQRAARQCDPSGACADRCSPWARLLPAAYIPANGCIGIGHERVMFAPFFIDSAQPFTHLSLKYEQGWGLSKPDRSEFFWAAPGSGPSPDGMTGESSVDVITLRARMETATERASAIFEVPMRAVDPEINKNTSGIGDLVVGGKVVIVNGRNWVVTQQTLTHLDTGPVGRGLGTGHVSFEPGLLVRYRWSNQTYLHGQLRYFIPVSGTDDYPGEVLIWGLGLSKIWYETDAFALLPTLEMVGTSFLDGQRTLPGATTAVKVDGETSIDFLTGLRLVLGPQGDLGLPELGISGGASVGDEGWFTGRILLEARWSF